MGKLKTCFSILNILADHKIHTAYELAKDTATTEKIVRSYISYMRNEGIEIDTYHGTNGGYKLIDCTESYTIRTSLNDEDVKAVERAIIAITDLKKIDYYNNIIYDLNTLRTKIKGFVEHEDILPLPYEPKKLKDGTIIIPKIN